MNDHQQPDDVREQIFNRGGQISRAFLHPSWAKVLVPCDLRLRCASFEALSHAAIDQGDQMVWIVDRAGHFPDESPVRVRWDRGEFDEVASNTSLGHVDVEVFGESRTWGMIVSPESFAVLGGTEKFMETFTALAGGTQALKAAFLAAVEANEVGFKLEGTDALRELLSAVGWT